MRFAEHLASLRSERGLTQKDLAGMISVDTRLVGRWEQGQGLPSFEYIVALSNVLEITADRLLMIDTNQRVSTNNIKLKNLLAKVESLSEKDVETVVSMLKLVTKNL